MLRAGDLDRQVVLLKPATADSPLGRVDAEPIVIATVWAKVREAQGREWQEGSAVTSSRRATFTLRYRTGLDALTSLQWDGLTWNVIARAEIGRREGIELQAEVVS